MRAFCAPTPVRKGSRVGATYSVPLDQLTEQQVSDERERLTLQARCSFGAPPPPYTAWFVDNGQLHVPRFYGLERFGPAESDDRVLGEPIAARFGGELRDVQTRAIEAVTGRHLCAAGGGGALVCIPCGIGKTVLSVKLVTDLGRKTCVIVHKGVIRDQWKQTFERFCPGIRVGILQGKTWEVDDCDVVIAMVLTLARHEAPPERFDAFGCVVVDECHHLAAPVMNLAIRKFRARWVLGLTATKERPDGLTPLLHWTLGPEGFRAEREGGEKVRVSVALFPHGAREIKNREGKPMVATMTNALAVNPARNAFIGERIARMRAKGRVVMVLSDRLKQLALLRERIVALGVPPEDIGLFCGSTREAERAAQLAKPVVFCSYAMANEGVDKREADTIVMATPKGRVVQCIGRVQRPCDTKQPPLVLDVVDDASVFQHLRRKRQKLYAHEKYEVQVLAHDAADDAWFS